VDTDRQRGTVLDQLGVFDHDHGVGATWNDAAGRNRRCGAGGYFKHWCNAAGDDFAIEREPLRCARSGAERIRRPHRKTVDIGPIERRRVDRGDHVSGNDPRHRSRKRDGFAGQRRAIEPRLEAPTRFCR